MIFNNIANMLHNPNSIQATEDLKNPGKMYIKMTTDDLNEFFSNEKVVEMKERCRKFYTMTDIKKAVFEANSLGKAEIHIHIVDILMACIGRIEYLENELKNVKGENKNGKEEQ